MAVAVVGTPASARDGGNPGIGAGGVTTSFTLDASAAYLLVPVSWTDNNTNSIASVSWNGVACAQVASASYEILSGIYAGVTWWWLDAPATGTHNLVTVQTTANMQGMTHGVIGLSGTAGSAPTFEATNTGTSNPATQAVTSAAGNLVLGIAQFFTTTVANITSNNTQAYEETDFYQNDQTINVAYDTATSPTMSWGNSGSVTWLMSIIEVAASGGGAVTSPYYAYAQQ